MQHIAMIMDGNRRWAKKNGLSSFYSDSSKRSVSLAMKFCLEKNIKFLSLYAFSLENFNRPQVEQQLIFKLLKEVINDELPELKKQNIRMRFVGDRMVFPESVIPSIEKVERETAHFDKLTVNILFCYGGKQELAGAMKSVAAKVKNGELSLEDINVETIKNHLWTVGTPDPDLIVRTSGTKRLSNFLTFQSAYSELVFLDCYWPELTETHLEQCTKEFFNAKRNLGH